MKLEVQELRAGYGAKLVLDGVGLTVPEGSIVTLLGPNGCGKSTLLKVIGRLLKPKSGNVLLDGRRSTPATPPRWRAGWRSCRSCTTPPVKSQSMNWSVSGASRTAPGLA